MKSRDKRRRVKARQTGIPLDRLRRCKVMTALVDETNCNAEQRIQKCQPVNGCAECSHLVKLIACKLTKTDIHPSVCEAARDKLDCDGCGHLPLIPAPLLQG